MRQILTTATLMVACAAPAHAQFISDGDLDDLDPGTPPDVGTPAGAWMFPDNYVVDGVAEMIPENLSIVATTDFDAKGSGNSLCMDVQEAIGNYHLPNLLDQVINEGDGIVTVSFRLWVVDGAGGGSVYVGTDNGGGGYSNALDRGPQLTFFPDGTLQVWDLNGAATTVANYSKDTWQNAILTIDLVSDTWDLLWSEGDADPVSVVEGQTFRSGALPAIDRFTYVRFAGEGGVANAYIDDITVDLEAGCAADCNGDGQLNILDFVCFQLEWQNQTPAGDCDGNGEYNILDFVCFQVLFQKGC